MRPISRYLPEINTFIRKSKLLHGGEAYCQQKKRSLLVPKLAADRKEKHTGAETNCSHKKRSYGCARYAPLHQLPTRPSALGLGPCRGFGRERRPSLSHRRRTACIVHESARICINQHAACMRRDGALGLRGLSLCVRAVSRLLEMVWMHARAAKRAHDEGPSHQWGAPPYPLTNRAPQGRPRRQGRCQHIACAREARSPARSRGSSRA